MKKKTEKEMKLFLQDSELNVIQARRTFDDVMQFVCGILSCLKTEGNITQITHDCFERNLQRLETQSKKIEIEFYKLKQKIEQ